MAPNDSLLPSFAADVIYAPETGEMRWKSGRLPRLNPKGYLRFMQSIDGKERSVFAHRLAWFIYYGKPPDHYIDHVNHDRTDNRIENLRDVPNGTNAKNIELKSRNTSGFSGVYWNKTKRKWKVCVKVAGKINHLGYFHDKEAAAERARWFYEQNGFHENHGKRLIRAEGAPT